MIKNRPKTGPAMKGSQWGTLTDLFTRVPGRAVISPVISTNSPEADFLGTPVTTRDGPNFFAAACFQIFDFRFVPIYAIFFLSAAYAALPARRENQAGLFKVFLDAGVGSLVFRCLRLVFFDAITDNPVWSDFW